MKICDGAVLWKKIQKAGLHEKTIGELSIQELELLADLFSEHAKGETPPYFRNGVLVFPLGAPRELRWWQRDMSDVEKYKMLKRLGVQDDDLHKYMHQGQIDAVLEQNKKKQYCNTITR